jgi:hypothetical protein
MSHNKIKLVIDVTSLLRLWSCRINHNNSATQMQPYGTDGQTDSPIHSLRVGWRNFFYSCAVVSVFGSGGEYVLRVQYSCGVVLVFGSGGK